MLLLARHHQQECDVAELMKAVGPKEGEPLSLPDMLEAARHIGLKGKVVTCSWDDLGRVPLPLIVQLNDGEYAVVRRMFPKDEHLIVLTPNSMPRAQRLSREQWTERWSGKAIAITTGLKLTNPNRPFGLLWFVPQLWKYRSVLRDVLVASLVVQFLAVTTPFFTQLVIDKVLVHHNFSALHVLGVGMLICMAFEAVLSAIRGHLMAHTASRMDATLESRLFRHLLRLPLAFFETRRIGDIAGRVRELEHVRRFLTGSSINGILDVLFAGVFILILLLYSPALTCIVIAIIPLSAGLSWLLNQSNRSSRAERGDQNSQSHSQLVEAISGIQTIKALAAESIFARRWDARVAKTAATSYQTAQQMALHGMLTQIISKLSILVILWFGATQVMEGKLTVGQLIAFQMLSSRVLSPLLRIVRLTREFEQVRESTERIATIFDAKTEPAGHSAAPGPIRGAVKFEGVSFRYGPESNDVLQQFNLSIAAGQTVGIVGRSGSGKSTMVKLLQRFHEPTAGAITIDGINLRHVDPTWLRRQLGVVLQENVLFNASIRENIAQHVPQASMERIVEAAKLAGAHPFISQLSDGYDTQVGDRGELLAGGQRQRIALARALISEPRVLILDEATSALDSEAERLIQQNLAIICRRRTVVIIAHRLSTVRHADLIAVIDDGRVVEQGTHVELLSRKGLYHHLHSQQTGHVQAVFPMTPSQES